MSGNIEEQFITEVQEIFRLSIEEDRIINQGNKFNLLRQEPKETDEEFEEARKIANQRIESDKGFRKRDMKCAIKKAANSLGKLRAMK